ALADGTEALFADAERGGWYRTASDHETLVAREKPNYDGAEPTGASVAVLNALRLHTITGDTRWRTIAQRALRFYTPTLTEHPTALHEMLLALDYFVDTPREVVLVWPPSEAPFMIGESSLTPLLEPLRRLFLPNRVLLGASEGAEIEALANLAPLASRKMVLTGLPTAYICEHGSCQLPTTDPATMTAQLTGY
ncbi:MAG: thioredoxin domain-containing protein, partial [Candidatus Eremiobacteraeota bacterium]|nr:thioredoxin domain-containing protein [Candidatus Eremiobacteraeota bacterium]